MVGSVVGSSGAVQVDVLEDARARVVWLETGQSCTVERHTLPADVREGDVVVDGRTEPEATALRRLEVALRRARLAVPVPPGLEL
ncbi:DUF3006 domain-containing protein [Myxococcus sp. K15C18031901]|uniref:DUF3006 domain-containing protein n=1 Tax=Myxococcus dinghuensis TaxID=2906761 RepID=UPI0020A7A29A|nr:DUF3006 domain-containing protein [Myxococcus dinghuensis]MCP3104833.1 DUF3006 domain-containing protein [Myxococcus dinghuensis]